MRIPKYWAKKSLQVSNHPVIQKISCWGYSEQSQSEAEKMAEERASKACDRLTQGLMPDRYLYSDRPMREEIVEEKNIAENGISYVITRNSYGALVLNSSGVMFVDIDQENTPGLIDRLLVMIGMKKLEKHGKIFSSVNSWLSDNPSWGIRLYETFKGYRMIITHDTFDPTDRISLSRLEKMGADRLYIKLCTAQECFRARLTPKPWRMGLPVPPGQFPRVNQEDIDSFRNWLAEYERLSSGYSACRLIGHFGNSYTKDEVARIIEHHDLICKADTQLPLA